MGINWFDGIQKTVRSIPPRKSGLLHNSTRNNILAESFASGRSPGPPSGRRTNAPSVEKSVEVPAGLQDYRRFAPPLPKALRPTQMRQRRCRGAAVLLVFVGWAVGCRASIPASDDLSSLTADDFKNAAVLSKDELFRDAIPVEEVNNHRTDIRGPWANARARVKRNGVSRPAKLWPHGRIPYAISPHYTTHERALLARAIKQYHDRTCVRFVPRSTGEGDYLFIGKVDGCFSEVGRTSGVQVLSLDNGCMEYPTIIHEMMHVVGFYHEHERWDRDTFIDIIWQNIDRGALDQFGKVDLSKTSYYGQPYDYRSILHYDSLAFSKNGFPTMLPKKAGYVSTIGNAKDFSDVDLAKINRMYKCAEKRALNTYLASVSAAKAQIAPIYAPPPSYKTALLGSGLAANAFVNRPPAAASVVDGHYSFYETAPPSPPLSPPIAPQQPSAVKSGAVCEDRITVCWWTQDRCLSPNIYVMMKSLCAKTCKFC